MATVQQILKIATNEVGTKESPPNSNNVKYNTWYYGKEVSGSGYPWCMAFVMWVLNETGCLKEDMKTASCTALYNYAKKNGLLVESPRSGDLVIFDWGKDGKPDHVGFIESTSGSTLYTIEGNTAVGNDSDGGEVMKRQRSTAYKYAYVRPNYGYKAVIKAKDYTWTKPVAYLPRLSKGDNNEYVAVLQTMLNAKGYNCGEVDGDFGSKTNIATENFQKNNGLTKDGIVGLVTWAKIFSK